MGQTDKARNEAQEYKGKAKEWIGDKTDDERLEAEGKRDQMSAHAKQAGEHIKDTAHDVADEFR